MAKRKRSVTKKRTARVSPKKTKKAGRRKRATRTADHPSDELRIALTFPHPKGELGPVRCSFRMSAHVVKEFVPEERTVGQALEHITRAGFRITSRGKLTASIRGSRQNFEKVFGTKLSTFRMDQERARNC